MFNRTGQRPHTGLAHPLWGALSLTWLFLLIEFFDELAFGVEGAALPSIRAELGLSYAQIGLLLGLPSALSLLVEPFILLLGDSGARKRLVVGGGFTFALAMLAIAGSTGFPVLLLAMIFLFPASGAFVSLSQATLMDLNPGREPQMMARWTVAGSLGSLFGPLFVAAGLALGAGWRWAYFALALFGLLLAIFALHKPFPAGRVQGGFVPAPGPAREQGQLRLLGLLANLREAIRNPGLLRWIVLLQFSDLLLDVFIGYAPLYLVDVVGASPAQASLLLGVLMVTSLAADGVLIPLLERLPGRTVVRASAAITIPLFVALLVVPWTLAKIVLMVIIRFSTLGWYQVLQGEAYAALPGRSATVTAVGSLAGLLGGTMTWLVGWIAAQAGLQPAMWLLLVGPVCLALFTPGVPQLTKNDA